MAEVSDSDVDAASERGRVADQTEPRAETARYDRDAGRIVVELKNGCTFAFPAHLAQALGTASAEQLSHVEPIGSGYGLHWEALNVDFTVPGLLSGIFGIKAYMARRAGLATSPAKAAAARANGAKGGRPRKAMRA